MTTLEVNLDGLVGPTHNYAGLSHGNVASEKFAKSVSNPKEAALQGLRKMKFVHDLGLPQLVMPPQRRPALYALRQLGFTKLADAPPVLLNQLFSASCMWTANAATVCPSADSADGKVHFTPANLISNYHRYIEAHATSRHLKQIFKGDCSVHHQPLPAQASYADEGAANHMRLCNNYDEKGTQIFVYGGSAKKYPARQTEAAVHAIARLHTLDDNRTVFLEQSAEAIDAGVFHNDVIAMSNGPLFIYHEKAYTNLNLKQIGYTPICISENELPLKDAVSTYFFNSQLITLPDGKMVVIAPSECAEHPKARACFNKIVSDGHIHTVHYLDVRESMKNGGGPACLRLRVVLTKDEREAVHPHVWLNDILYKKLCGWIENHYRDRISPDDLRDPLLAEEVGKAMDVLSTLLAMDLEIA
jgi:succinylarginine dihydrolase